MVTYMWMQLNNVKDFEKPFQGVELNCLKQFHIAALRFSDIEFCIFSHRP